MMVEINTTRKRGLLVNPSKTFTSVFFSFLALISLNTYKKTNMLKNSV